MPDKNLSWLDDVEIGDELYGDLKLVHEWCGREVLKKLWEHFPSMSIYVTTKPLDRLKRQYVKKHWNGRNLKELCSRLEVSERFIYDTLEERNQLVNQQSLFSVD
jgi:Mor family transcriptional regulator